MKKLPKVSEEHFLQKRLHILEAAKAVFCRKGFEPTTMQDVVEASGMSRGGVYRYFSSTEEMIRALLEKNNKEFIKYINELIDEHDKMWDALEDYLQNLESEASDPFSIVVYEYFVTGWRTEERRNYLARRYENGKAIFLRLFDEGVRRGEFSPKQPLEAINSFFINVNDGISMEATLLDEKTVRVAEQIKALKMYLKQALGLTK